MKLGILRWMLAILLAFTGRAYAECPPKDNAASPNPTLRDPTEVDSPSDERMWITRTADAGGRGGRIEVSCADQYCVGDAMAFACAIFSDEEVGEGVVGLDVLTEQGRTLAQEVVAHYITEGRSECSLELELGALADGRYTLRLQVLRFTDFVMAWRELTLEKLSLANVENALEQAKEEIEALRKHLDVVDPASELSLYIAARTSIAHDALPYGRRAFEAGNWPAAMAVAQHGLRAADSMRAYLSFARFAEEIARFRTMPPLDRLEHKAGRFIVDGNPAFLAGVRAAEGSIAPERVARYGLNLVWRDAGPDTTLVSQTNHDEVKSGIAKALDAANRANVAVVASLAPHTAPEWALDKWPLMHYEDIAERGYGTINLAHPGAQRMTELHVEAVAPCFANVENLAALCVADRPYLRFSGAEVRRGFIDFVKSRYKDRHEVNWSWKTRLANLEDIETGLDKGRPAYQFDWQFYQQQLAGDYFQHLEDQVRKYAPNAPLGVRFADDLFQPEATRGGVDPEALVGMMDVVMATAGCSDVDEDYAFQYPRQSIVLSLLHSLDPHKPLCNVLDRFPLPRGPRGERIRAYAHSLLWEAAMSGASGYVMPSGFTRTTAQGEQHVDMLAFPEFLDGYATACLDLNRLGDVVTAFQEAPAEVMILWSMSSKIFRGGQAHLKSVERAYEGCSFSGWHVRFITEKQCAEGGLAGVEVLVIPDTPAAAEPAFEAIEAYVREGGIVVRGAMPMLYDERGHSRRGILHNTLQTILIDHTDTPTQYLHALDAANVMGRLPAVPRPVNAFGYPLEGVRTRYVRKDGEAYLYVLNLRKQPVACHLAGGSVSGRDLIRGRDVSFPTMLDPLDPMLIRIEAPEEHIAQDVTFLEPEP